jgi:hypothetical protein
LSPAHGRDTGEQGKVRFPPPRLTFACELDPARLMALFAGGAVTDDRLALRARARPGLRYARLDAPISSTRNTVRAENLVHVIRPGDIR